MRDRAVAESLHAAQHGARGDAGAGEHHVALRHLLQRELPLRIGVPHLAHALHLFIVLEHQPPLHLPADAAQRRRRQHALGRATGAKIDVDLRVGRSGRDHAGHVAIADQHDARAGLAHLGDQLLVPVAVEDAGDQVGHLAFLGPGEFAQVLANRRVEIDHAVGQAAADGDLVHVDVGRMQEIAVLGQRHDGERARARPWRSAWCPPADRPRCPSAARRRRPSRRYRASAPRPSRLRRSPRCRRWRPDRTPCAWPRPRRRRPRSSCRGRSSARRRVPPPR